MKKILLIMFTLITISTSAQKISRDEYDKFTKNRNIETSYLTMYKKMTLISTEHGVNLALRKYGNSYVLLADIKNIEPIRFVKGNGMIFLFDNDSTIELNGNLPEAWNAKSIALRALGRTGEADEAQSAAKMMGFLG